MRQFTYVITSPVGIHARPAGLLVETVKALDSRVTVHKGDKSAQADRMITLMLLEVCQGDTVTVTVQGPQEKQDAHALELFFHTHL